MPKKKTASGTPAKPISRKDWDFSLCPPEQLSECYCWEYARNSASFLEDVQRFRARAKSARTFQEFFDFYQECRATDKSDSLPRNVHKACIFNFSPEFPDQPFLSIEGGERKQRVSFVNEVCRGGQWMAALMDFQPIPWQNIFHWGSDELERRRRNVRRKMVAFDMDWTLSEPELVGLFCAWMRKERKRDGSAPRETRGAGSAPTQYRTWLKQLGAMRLVGRMGWEKARDHSFEVAGKSLYQNQAAWIRADTEAKGRLTAFSKESF